MYLNEDIAVIPADLSREPYILSLANLQGVEHLIGAEKVKVIEAKEIEARLFVSDMASLGVFEPINLRATALLWMGNNEEYQRRRYIAGDAVVADIVEVFGLNNVLRESVFGIAGHKYRVVITMEDKTSVEPRQRFHTCMDALAESINMSNILARSGSIEIYRDGEKVS